MATSKSNVEVLTAGSRLTIQDLGRRGSQRFGVSVSGVLDLQAAVLANRLVGNPASSAVLESLFGGMSLVFDADTKIAITGAEVTVDVDGHTLPIWETLIAPADAVLNISVPSAGLYAYVAVAGGLDIPSVLGSRSTHAASGIGGLEERALASGDILPIGDETDEDVRPSAGTTCPDVMVPACRETDQRIRVTAGPQFDAFDDDAKSSFLASNFTISNLTDRQGARLDGAEIPAIGGKHDIVSDPAYMGAVQVPADGKPIVLLADRQPTGGYAKIASVISADLPSVVQKAPGSDIAFELIEVEQAQELAREFNNIILDAPLQQPLDTYSTHFEIAGETYNVHLVRPTNVSNGDEIVYVDFGDKTEVVATVEVLEESSH
ncbi:MAG: biotin-dependent carboxyltransferase [Chloroflexi bacterium]|nr:biotin-dependent carboxyltransferase [Chloroflexota bacterium]